MIITGCQRSGTMSAAAIFGIPHEHKLTPDVTFEKLTHLTYPINESSWLAQPFAKFINKEIKEPVIHLVRHPLAVINSLMGIGFWTSNAKGVGEGHESYCDFIYQHLPGIEKLTDSLIQSMYYYVYWNKVLVNGGFPRIRIESIMNAPLMNRRLRAKLTWSDLPQGKLKTDLEEMAELFGYEYE